MYKILKLVLYMIFYIFLTINFAYCLEFKCLKNSTNTLNVKDFGARGDGISDDTQSFKNTVLCAKKVLKKKGSAIIKIQAGIYKISEHIDIIQTKDDITWKSLKINGDGINQTILLSEKGVFKINLITREPLIEIEDLSFVATKQSSGKAIEIYMPPGGNRHNRSLVIKDILITGFAPDSNTYFNFGIKAIGVWRPLIENVFMTGPFGPKRLPLPKDSICYYLEEVYSPEISKSACWSADIGVVIKSSTNPAPEGLQIISSKFVDVNTGIYIDNVNAIEPEGFIQNNHINARIYGLILKGKRFVNVDNNLFYTSNTDDFVMLLLERSEKIIISRNTFHYPDRMQVQSGISIKIDKEVEDVVISENLFNAPKIAIYISKFSKDIHTYNNTFLKENKITKIKLNEVEIYDENRK